MGGLAAGSIVLAVGGFTLLHTPNWYSLPPIAPQARQAVRDNLISAEQVFTEALRTSETPFIYHVYQDDVNRWIAMRREIYPLIDQLAPPELNDPMVLFEAEEITVAGRYRKLGTEVVVSLDVSVSFSNDEILLRVVRVRCGSMSVPLTFVSMGLKREIDRPEGSVWPGSPHMWGDFADGFHVASRGWWKNGGINYRVRNLTVEPGKLNLEIEPLGHQAPKGSKHQR